MKYPKFRIIVASVVCVLVNLVPCIIFAADNAGDVEQKSKSRMSVLDVLISPDQGEGRKRFRLYSSTISPASLTAQERVKLLREGGLSQKNNREKLPVFSSTPSTRSGIVFVVTVSDAERRDGDTQESVVTLVYGRGLPEGMVPKPSWGGDLVWSPENKKVHLVLSRGIDRNLVVAIKEVRREADQRKLLEDLEDIDFSERNSMPHGKNPDVSFEMTLPDEHPCSVNRIQALPVDDMTLVVAAYREHLERPSYLISADLQNEKAEFVDIAPIEQQ